MILMSPCGLEGLLLQSMPLRHNADKMVEENIVGEVAAEAAKDAETQKNEGPDRRRVCVDKIPLYLL